jgi:hypothetical protein
MSDGIISGCLTPGTTYALNPDMVAGREAWIKVLEDFISKCDARVLKLTARFPMLKCMTSLPYVERIRLDDTLFTREDDFYQTFSALRDLKKKSGGRVL